MKDRFLGKWEQGKGEDMEERKKEALPQEEEEIVLKNLDQKKMCLRRYVLRLCLFLHCSQYPSFSPICCGLQFYSTENTRREAG